MKNLDTYVLPLISCALNVRASISFLSSPKRVRNKRNKITNTLYNPMELFIKQRRHCGVLMKLYYGSYTLNDSCGSSHVRTYAQTKMKSDLCMLLHHALHWAVYETSQFMRLWYLSHMQPAKAQTSLHICTVLPGA